MQVNMNQLKDLRQKTGAGFSDCKNALVEADSNIEKAIIILKEKGILKVSKKASRRASEGQIHILMNADKSECSLVELNCETDFVSRTPEFSKGAYKITKQIHEHKIKSVDQNMPESVQEEIQTLIQKLGENIVIGYINSVNDKNNAYVASYIHTGNQLGVVVWISVGNKDLYSDESFIQFGKDLAMHIAAMNPTSISKDNISKDWLEEQRNIFTKQIEQEKKPAHIQERIIEGKLAQLLNETVLLQQPFAKDPSKRLQQWIKEHEKKWSTLVKVVRFIRKKVGESL